MSGEKGTSVEEATASPPLQATNGTEHNIQSASSPSDHFLKPIIKATSNSNGTATQNGAYMDNSVVWVRLGQSWWPGSVVALERCPQDFVCDLKKTPLAVVKFFEENGFVDIHKQDHIYPYNCERKKEFIKKGLSFHARRLHHYRLSTENNLRSVQNKEELFKKFESDVLMAQKLTGGAQDVFQQIEEDSNKRRIDYSNLGFGPPKPKKKKDDAPRRLGSDIGEAVRYKKESLRNERQMILKHKVVIMEQPHVENMKEDLNKSCNSYKCYVCGFTCSRLGVIVWHHKGHIKTIMDYDTGIRMPGRKKRKPKSNAVKNKNKGKKPEAAPADHSTSNGHIEPEGNSLQARQLLMDWDDDDENNDVDVAAEGSPPPTLNNGHSEDLGPEPASGDEANEAEQVHDRGQSDRSNRRPMRAAEDLNSAFDALLADTPNTSNLTPHDQHNNYSNNQSDSEGSDWEKYYTKDSDDDDDYDADDVDDVKESDIKSLCEGSDMDEASDALPAVTNGALDSQQTNGASDEASTSPSIDEEDEPTRDSFSAENSHQTNDRDAADGEEEEEEEGHTKDTGGSSSTTSSSPSNSGPAFMLVAVDAQGNNVPMPALTDRNHSSNLVAVEASMEDGTSRTLYIDPAYLEPNVDLSNLMLHIDNSGQETVIIPSTTSQDTASSSTSPRDSSGPAPPRLLAADSASSSISPRDSNGPAPPRLLAADTASSSGPVPRLLTADTASSSTSPRDSSGPAPRLLAADTASSSTSPRDSSGPAPRLLAAEGHSTAQITAIPQNTVQLTTVESVSPAEPSPLPHPREQSNSTKSAPASTERAQQESSLPEQASERQPAHGLNSLDDVPPLSSVSPRR